TRPKHTRAYPRAHPVIVPLTLWSLRYWTRHGRRPARAGTSTARVGSVPITSPRHGPDPRHPRGRDRYGEDRSTALPVLAGPGKENRSQSLPFSSSATGSPPTGIRFRWVTPASRNASIRSRTYDSGPTRFVNSTISSGTAAAASSFLPAR